jgi:hypothetical protein
MESGRMEKSMYDREVAWTVAGGEISIEEVRAMVRCSYVNKKVAIPIDADNPPEIWKCRRIAPKPVQKPKVQPVVAPQPIVRSQVSLLRGLLIYFFHPLLRYSLCLPRALAVYDFFACCPLFLF